MIQQRVTKYREKEHLFSLDAKVLIALSGGADSVALLCILHTAGYHCEAAHCNFHLRGEESDRDELFVRQLCKRTGIHLHTIDFNTTQYAKEKQISIEMAARELRYDWFEKTRKECQADVIAVAHHQDDSVETILLNLIRGTGITGLLGIRPPQRSNRAASALRQSRRYHSLSGEHWTRLCNRQYQSGRRIYP